MLNFACRHLRAIQAPPGLTVLEHSQSSLRTGLGEFVYPGRRPGLFSARAVQINEQISFGVQVVRGLYAIGGLRENRVDLG